MALGSASWNHENSPGRPDAHPGRALALPAPWEPPGSVRAAADCTPPSRSPGAATDPSASQPTSPQALENSSSTLLLVLGALFLHPPTRLAGSADTRWADAHCRRPRKKILSHNFARSEGLSLSPGLKMVRRKPKVALSTLLEIRKWANNCPLRVEKDTRNRLLGHPKSPSRRVNTLFGAPLRLLAPPSAGVRAGCSGLQVPRGGPGDAGGPFSQSAHLPPSS